MWKPMKDLDRETRLSSADLWFPPGQFSLSMLTGLPLSPGVPEDCQSNHSLPQAHHWSEAQEKQTQNGH